MLQVYGDRFSGNCYKVQLILDLTGRPYRWVDIDIMKGQSRTPEFLALSPVGRIPIVVLDDGAVLSESNAILLYFAEGSPYLPEDRLERARVYQWLFFEQYNHEPNIATLRFWTKLAGFDEARRAAEPAKRKAGLEALGVMEQRLAAHPFLVGDRFTVADIALFAYTHVAADGGFDLRAFPAVSAWLDRVRVQPGFAPMVAG
ncbi:MAG: glutathione S-transferase family protein [Alphaproteobacteria bacterium]